jgi:hypothetical protein
MALPFSRVVLIVGMALLSISFAAQNCRADVINVLGTPLGDPIPPSGVIVLQQSDTITPSADCPGCSDWQLGMPLAFTQIELVTDSSANILDSETTLTFPIITSLTSFSLPASPIMTFDFTGFAPGTYYVDYILIGTFGNNECLLGDLECSDLSAVSGAVTWPNPVVATPEPDTIASFFPGLLALGLFAAWTRHRKSPLEARWPSLG